MPDPFKFHWGGSGDDDLLDAMRFEMEAKLGKPPEQWQVEFMSHLLDREVQQPSTFGVVEWVMLGIRKRDGEVAVCATERMHTDQAEIEERLGQEAPRDQQLHFEFHADVAATKTVEGVDYNDAMDALLTAGWDPDDLPRTTPPSNWNPMGPPWERKSY